jgi:hypothetical protein
MHIICQYLTIYIVTPITTTTMTHGQVIVEASMSAGTVKPLGRDVAILGNDAKSLKLADKLIELGVVSSGQNNWCGMVSGFDGVKQSQLLEYQVSDGSGDIRLEGIICPKDNYDKVKHVCSWKPSEEVSVMVDKKKEEKMNTKPSQKQTKGNSGMGDECPLCKFIKDGGCKDAFEPFQKCVALASEEEELAKKSGVEAKNKRVCIHLFDPVIECMQSSPEKRDYYAVFIKDFSHLFTAKKQ